MAILLCRPHRDRGLMRTANQKDGDGIPMCQSCFDGKPIVAPVKNMNGEVQEVVKEIEAPKPYGAYDRKNNLGRKKKTEQREKVIEVLKKGGTYKEAAAASGMCMASIFNIKKSLKGELPDTANRRTKPKTAVQVAPKAAVEKEPAFTVTGAQQADTLPIAILRKYAEGLRTQVTEIEDAIRRLEA